MTAFREDEKKNSSLKQHSKTQRLRKDDKATEHQTDAEINDQFEYPVSTHTEKTFHRELHNAEYHGRTASRKLLLSKTNVAMRLK